jgi:hypothetical protein
MPVHRWSLAAESLRTASGLHAECTKRNLKRGDTGRPLKPSMYVPETRVILIAPGAAICICATRRSGKCDFPTDGTPDRAFRHPEGSGNGSVADATREQLTEFPGVEDHAWTSERHASMSHVLAPETMSPGPEAGGARREGWAVRRDRACRHQPRWPEKLTTAIERGRRSARMRIAVPCLPRTAALRL